jgi:polyhydroxyalkanoate synthase
MNKFTSDEIIENCQKASVYYQQILIQMLNNKDISLPLKFMFTEEYKDAATKVVEQTFEHPERFVDINIEYFQKFQQLVSGSISKFLGGNKSDNNSAVTDKRFKEPEWNQNIYFDFIKQYYLLTSSWINKTTDSYDLDNEGRRYIQFSVQQFIDAISPANFAFSNPVVIKESLETGFENIVKGMENFLRDIRQSGGLFNVSTTDQSYFKIGKDIAATTGKVIYQNELMQLLCYQPKNEVYKLPLLIIPPWINKYYILDLSEKNSMVKWLVENNFQVFLISWKNPDRSYSRINFEDYLNHGVIAAINEIKKLGFSKVNAVGYCIGGTLLSIALSYFKQKKDDIINSASFLTTLIDFSTPGEIGTLINKHTFKVIEQEVNKKGFLDGKYLSNSFSLIRANDLIWSFFINNYLLGKAPAAFDILYWNADPTNLPAKMYMYYLKNMYIENNLIKNNNLEMLGHKIDVTKIDLPTFSLAAKGDHIAIWSGVYDGYKLLGGDKTFCLTDAGHVAGVVNPADNTKYSYLIGADINQDYRAWLKNAKSGQGSWWNPWKEWLTKYSSDLGKSIDYNSLKAIEEAPGSYVKTRV